MPYPKTFTGRDMMFMVGVLSAESWVSCSGNFYILPCPMMSPSVCSQLSVSLAPQPPQAQTPPSSSCLLGKPPGLPDPSHKGTGRAQAQAGEATGTWPWGRSWNQPSSDQGESRPALSPAMQLRAEHMISYRNCQTQLVRLYKVQFSSFNFRP